MTVKEKGFCIEAKDNRTIGRLPEMIMLYEATDAWEAFESKKLQLAEHIWLSLMAVERDPEAQCRNQLAYAMVLAAQKRYHEAIDILTELYDITGNSLYLHQLGALARDEGKLELAKTHLLAEQSSLSEQDHFGQAANCCELAWTCLLQKRLLNARHYGLSCLDHARQAHNGVMVCSALQLLYDTSELQGDPTQSENYYQELVQAQSELPIHLVLSELDPRLLPLLPLVK